MPRKKTPALSDDLPQWLREALQISDLKQCERVVLHEIRRFWRAKHPSGSRNKGGAPVLLTEEAVFIACETVWNALGPRDRSTLNWKELILRVQLKLGTHEKGKRQDDHYSEATIRKHVRKWILSTKMPSVMPGGLIDRRQPWVKQLAPMIRKLSQILAALETRGMEWVYKDIPELKDEVQALRNDPRKRRAFFGDLRTRPPSKKI